jgi:hypothetical protein
MEAHQRAGLRLLHLLRHRGPALGDGRYRTHLTLQWTLSQQLHIILQAPDAQNESLSLNLVLLEYYFY